MKILAHSTSTARGSVGGSTYSANQFAPIVVRARSAGVQPCTLRQSQIKANFAMTSARWRCIGNTKREGWGVYAKTISHSGPIGSYRLTGRHLFIGNYGFANFLHTLGELTSTPRIEPPVIPGIPGIRVLQIKPLSIPGTGFKITGINPNPEQTEYVVHISRPFHPSRMRFKGPYLSDSVYTDTKTFDSGFSIDVTGLIEGKRYFCSIRSISVYGPHRLSALFHLNTTATITP